MLGRSRQWLLLGSLLVATVLVVVLANQLREVRAEYADLQERTRFLQAGMYVPPFHGATLNGDSIAIAASDPETRQVLLVYNTSCPYCEATIPAWQRLSARLDDEPGVEIYGLSLDPGDTTRSYSDAHELRYPSVLLSDERMVSMYRASVVPQTLVVHDGRVIHARVGLMEEDAALDSVVAAVKGR